MFLAFIFLKLDIIDTLVFVLIYKYQKVYLILCLYFILILIWIFQYLVIKILMFR